MEQITFCPCGRVAVKDNRCMKHIGKDFKKKNRSVKFSGYSKWREDNGMFQAREGR